MKKCSCCKETKSFEDFNKSKTEKDGRQNFCRYCSNKHRKQYYLQNKEKETKRIKKRDEDLRKWLFEYKSNQSCKKCGFNKHAAALDFHHRDPLQKDITISKMISDSYSKENILKEIQKCDILCSNCHRIFHYKENYISD